MVDLHKGFEGFERLSPSKKDREEKDILLSKSAPEGLSLGKSDLARSEALYDGMLAFTRSVLDKVRDGKENSLNAEEILGRTREFASALQTSTDPDDLVRLVIKRDDYKENYLYTHSVNVCLLAVRVGLEMNFAGSLMHEFVMASLFHDIGMMKVPLDIWNKDRKFKEQDIEAVHKHPSYGEEIFRKLPGVSETVPVIIGQHQEKADGSGYPRGLAKDSIHYLARLLSLLDSYEAQTHTRLFRTRFLPDKAIQQILDEESASYDPHYIKALLRHISIFPVGSWVTISTGEIGEVVKTNKDTPMRPIINVVFDRFKRRLSKTRLIDLSKQLLIHVDSGIDMSEGATRQI
jgi:HD-GYP domain-containing protein (c-di-GMP phosphodiesterase class II)